MLLHGAKCWGLAAVPAAKYAGHLITHSKGMRPDQTVSSSWVPTQFGSNTSHSCPSLRQAVLLLVNAIYFKGSWATPFIK